MADQFQELQCAFCHSFLFEEDDIVYCPVCGAPHHRECYRSCGHCAVEADHGTPRQYRRPVRSEPEPGTGSAAQGGVAPGHGPIPHDRTAHVCPRCGKTSTSDTLFCPYCGFQFAPPGQQPPAGAPFPFRAYPTPEMLDPLGGVDPTDTIDGIPVSDVSSFVHVNTRRYIPLFSRMSKENKKSSWNWAGFLFPFAWLFTRKCYKSGALTALLYLAFSLFTLPLQICMIDFINTLPESQQTYAQLAMLLQENPLSAPWWTWLLFFGGGLLTLGIHIFMGVLGDSIYKSHAVDKIRALKEDEEIEDVHEAIAAEGGVNLMWGVLAWTGMRMLTQLILIFII